METNECIRKIVNSHSYQMIDDFDEDDLSFVEMLKEVIRRSMLISEMEKTINQIIPNANFKYPMEDYLDYDEIAGALGWEFPKGKAFIQEQLDYLKKTLVLRT